MPMSNHPSPETLVFLDQPVQIHRRARRKKLSVSMHPDRPICVHTNASLTQKQILDFLTSKQNWIQKNLAKIQQLKATYKIPALENGALFPFLGETKFLQFTNTALKKPFFRIEEGFLIGYLEKNKTSQSYSQRELFEKIKIHYKEQASAFLPERVQYWINQTGLKPHKISFRAPKRRWGSCNSKRHISLNWKLICQPLSLIDYVIVHELCHLQHLNHSDQFWNLVERHLPNYQELERLLQEQERLSIFLND